MKQLSKKEILIIGAIIAIIIGVIGYYIYTVSMPENDYEELENISNQKEEIKEKIEEEKIIVHIAGEVNNPGIVKIRGRCKNCRYNRSGWRNNKRC